MRGSAVHIALTSVSFLHKVIMNFDRIGLICVGIP